MACCSRTSEGEMLLKLQFTTTLITILRRDWRGIRGHRTQRELNQHVASPRSGRSREHHHTVDVDRRRHAPFRRMKPKSLRHPLSRFVAGTLAMKPGCARCEGGARKIILERPPPLLGRFSSTAWFNAEAYVRLKPGLGSRQPVEDHPRHNTAQ